MRRPHDYFGATNRGGNVPAFSTPSPGQELMKRLRLLPERLEPSALFVCLFEPTTLFHYPSIAFYRGPSTLPSSLPPRFAVPPPRLSRGPPSHPARKTRFKSHSVAPRLPSNGCIESAPSRPSRSPTAFSSARFRYSTNVFVGTHSLTCSDGDQ